MLRIFTPVKIQRLRPGLNPQTWVPEASNLTTRPPKPSFRYLALSKLRTDHVHYMLDQCSFFYKEKKKMISKCYSFGQRRTEPGQSREQQGRCGCLVPHTSMVPRVHTLHVKPKEQTLIGRTSGRSWEFLNQNSAVLDIGKHYWEKNF